MRRLLHDLCLSVGLMLLIALSPQLAVAEDAESLQTRSKAVLSQLTGTLKAPGLKAPVEVLRDRWGVPHIYAQNQDDLFFAQGFVAAQDRLFQLDMWRRVAIGETAVVLGEAGVAGDRFARLIKYRGDMRAEWTSYSPDTKEIATAFTRGINALIDSLDTPTGERLPIEFQLLGYRPAHWQPEDILGRMAGVVMVRNFRSEIDRARLIAAVGVDEARRLAPTDPSIDFALAPELAQTKFHPKMMSLYEAATKRHDFAKLPPGSNNWIVDATLSASGAPLLANDPHRALMLPSLRYVVHLHAPGWNVIGGGEPGLPGVAIGRNEHLAWGMTIVGNDQSDLFIERLHADDPDKYQVGDEWRTVEIIRETIDVRGQSEPVELELRYTRHGPIIYEDREQHIAIALKWVGAEPGTAGYLGCLRLDRAKNAAEFIAGTDAWKLPSENLVYATKDGDIGWVASALTPVRGKGDGLLPVPGWNDDYRWTGFLPTSALPQRHNPPQHYIATANHNILPPGYSKAISYEWSAPHRFLRCEQRLLEQSKHTLDSFGSIQHEVTSLPGQALAKIAGELGWTAALAGEPSLVEAAKLLAAWDGKLTRDSAAGALYVVWFDELVKGLYRERVPPDLLSYCTGGDGQQVLLAALAKPDERWFGSEPVKGRDRLLATTFRAAVSRVEQRLTADQKTWQWGKLHQLKLKHPLSNRGPEFAKVFDLQPVATGGDGTTPFNARFNDNFEQIHGASFRLLADLSDPDATRATSVPGQSGQPGSEHYSDLLPLWAEGQYFPLYMTRPKVESAATHHLRLEP